MSHQINVWGGVTMCIIYCGWLAKYFHSLFRLFNIREINLVMLETSPLHLDPRASSTSAVAQNIFPTCHNLPSCFIDNLCAHTHTLHSWETTREERKPFSPLHNFSSNPTLHLDQNDSLFPSKKVTKIYRFPFFFR